MRSHAAAAAQLLIAAGSELGDNLVAETVEDWRTAAVTDKDRALYSAVESFVLRRSELSSAFFDDLSSHGWTQGQLFETLTISALFSFYNAWVDSAGVEDMTPDEYQASGRRIAKAGYLKD